MPKLDLFRDTYAVKQEDVIYNEMLRALALYHKVMRTGKFRSKSEIIMYLIKTYIPPMVEEINEKEGTDILLAYRKAVYGEQSINKRFEEIVCEARNDDLLDKSLEKHINRNKLSKGFKKGKF